MKAPRLDISAVDRHANDALRACSEGARLLWHELVMLMNRGERRGFLLVDGQRPTPARIAELTGTDPTKVKERLAELEKHGVFGRETGGAVYCREIVAQEKAKADGKRGGNPKLLASHAESSTLKGGLGGLSPLKGGDKGSGLVETSKPLEMPIKTATLKGSRKSLIGDSESGKLPSNTESLPNKPARKRARGGSTIFDREFEETFWPAYPRKEPKEPARLKFAGFRATGVPLQAIMDGLAKHRRAWEARGCDDTLIPMATTWLHQRRWADEPAMPSPAATARCGTVAPPIYSDYYNLDALAEPAALPKAANGRAGP